MIASLLHTVAVITPGTHLIGQSLPMPSGLCTNTASSRLSGGHHKLLASSGIAELMQHLADS